MITHRFPHARFLMQPSGSRIVSIRNQHTAKITYPRRHRFIGLICAAAGALAVVVLVVGVMYV